MEANYPYATKNKLGQAGSLWHKIADNTVNLLTNEKRASLDLDP